MRWELEGSRKLANFANGLGEGHFAKGGRFSDGRAGLGILPARVDRRVRGACRRGSNSQRCGIAKTSRAERASEGFVRMAASWEGSGG